MKRIMKCFVKYFMPNFFCEILKHYLQVTHRSQSLEHIMTLYVVVKILLKVAANLCIQA